MRMTVIFIIYFLCCHCNDPDRFLYRGKVPEPRLVLYAYVEADSLVSASITKSQTHSDNTYIDSTCEVKGSIFFNERHTGKLYPTGANRYISQVRPRSGDRVTIKISRTGFKDIEATTIVCSPFPEIRVDTIRNGNLLQLLVHLEDDGRTINYYRLVVEKEADCFGWHREDNGSKLGQYMTYTYQMDASGDKLLGKDIISTILGKEKNPNVYHVFSNETFTGKEHSLNVQVNYPFSYRRKTWTIIEKDTVHYVEKKHYRLRVKILRIDDPLYQYLYTLGIYETQPKMYKEPVQVYSNVKAGFGVLGSYFTREVVIDFPPKENP